MLFSGTGLDIHFCAVRDEEFFSDIHRECLTLWKQFEPLADKKFKQQFSESFDTCFWEMYLGSHLLNRYPDAVGSQNQGPDFHLEINGQKVFIEATVASRGSTKDAIPNLGRHDDKREPLVAFKESVLRVTAKLKDKAEANSARKYAQKGPYIVAINLPYKEVWLCTNPPLAAQATLGVKGRVIEFNEYGVSSSFTHNSSVLRASDALVSTECFLREDFAHISALIVASVNPFSTSYSSPSLELLHNPKATKPLGHGLVGFGREYWVESGVLKEFSYDD